MCQRNISLTHLVRRIFSQSSLPIGHESSVDVRRCRSELNRMLHVTLKRKIEARNIVSLANTMKPRTSKLSNTIQYFLALPVPVKPEIIHTHTEILVFLRRSIPVKAKEANHVTLN